MMIIIIIIIIYLIIIITKIIIYILFSVWNFFVMEKLLGFCTHRAEIIPHVIRSDCRSFLGLQFLK